MGNHTDYDGKAVSAELLEEFGRAFGNVEGVRKALDFVRGEGESPGHRTGFVWSATSQGGFYWASIFNNYSPATKADIEYLEQMLEYAEKRDGSPTLPTPAIEWTDWQMITSGEPDIPDGVRSEITKRDRALPVSADNPTMYRYEVKPVALQPFAVAFDADGDGVLLWSNNHGGDWRENARRHTARTDYTLRFYEGGTSDAAKLREERDALLALVREVSYVDDYGELLNGLREDTDWLDQVTPEQAAIVRALLERPQ